MRVIGLILMGVCLQITSAFTQKLAGTLLVNGKVQEGYTLFTSLNTKNTYLIDNCGNVVNSWQSQYVSGSTAYLMNNGNLLRAVSLPNPDLTRGGGGGGIEIMDWDSNILWTFEYNSPLIRQHHDILPLDNGNILVLAWNVHSAEESIAEGRDPALIADGVVWSEEIVEVKPIFPNSFEIVWRWKLWDHLVQDFDPTKNNHGVVSAHPELVDLNFADGNDDWVHLNALGYNKDLDQIMVCTPIFDEFWIIDHTTTTAQAATHSGGHSNKGGDLLYRWGNPQTYKQGTELDRKINGVHNAHWIEKGLPSAGKVLLFHNTAGGTGSTRHSAVEIIKTPLNLAGTYDLTNGVYGPESPSFLFKASPAPNLYSSNMSGAEMQPNGNLLICPSQQGRLVEITPQLDTAWIYKSPITTTGIAVKDFTPANADFKSDPSFRAMKYPPDYLALAGKDLTAGDAIEGPKVECYIITAVSPLIEFTVSVYPNPVSNYLYVESTNATEELDVRLIDLYGREVAREHGCGTVRVSMAFLPDGVFLARVNNQTTKILKQRRLE